MTFIHRGDWVPLLPERYRWPTVLLLIVTPFVGGVDFILGENKAAASIVEKAMPAWAWGVLLITSGTLAIAGYVGRWPKICIAGLHGNGVLYCVLAIGVGLANIDSTGGFRGPWLYVIVSAASWLSALGYADQIRGHHRAD